MAREAKGRRGRRERVLAPLRKIEGVHARHPWGGYRLWLECRHVINAGAQTARGKRARCVKCRDGKPLDR